MDKKEYNIVFQSISILESMLRVTDYTRATVIFNKFAELLNVEKALGLRLNTL